MKITKSYLRQLVVESLEEVGESPYKEFISKAVDIFRNERFYSDEMIKHFNTVDRQTLKKIVNQARNDESDNAVVFKEIIDDMRKSFRFIANKLSDGPENPTSNRYSDEPGITVAENKTLSKDSIRQMIRESLEKGNRNPIRKKFVKTFPTGEFDNPNINPKDVDPMIDLMNVSGMEEEEYEKYSKLHDSFMKIPAIKKMWNEFVAKKKQEISE